MIYTMKNWDALIASRSTGLELEVDQEIYDYFLEVLPPAGMPWNAEFADGTKRKCDFGFAEGAENVWAFWRKGGRYFCRLTTQMNPWR